MQKGNRKPTGPRYRPKSEAQKQRHREEVERAGGWYNWHKQQRENRERQQREAEAGKTSETSTERPNTKAKTGPTAKDRRDRIVTYPQRRYVNDPSQITGKGDKC